MSIIPPTENFISSGDNIASIYYEINKNIKAQIFLYSDIEFVNLYDALSCEKKFLINLFSYDGIHINNQGYSKLSTEIYKKLY